MGLLDGVLGGLVGAGATKLIESVIEQNGGLQGLVQNFEKNGLGGIMQSWVSTGTNQAVSTDQMSQALGSDALSKLAASTGLNTNDLLAQLVQHLPNVVDKMTPNGSVS